LPGRSHLDQARMGIKADRKKIERGGWKAVGSKQKAESRRQKAEGSCSALIYWGRRL